MAGADERELALSAAIFGNEKLSSIVHAVQEGKGFVTVQQLAVSTGFAYSLVRDVMQRLLRAGVLGEQRTGGSRSERHFFVDEDDDLWKGIVALSAEIRARAQADSSTVAN